MNLIGTALTGIYVVVVTWSASATPGEPGDSAGSGVVNIGCNAGTPTSFTVSQPDTTVRVTCPKASTSRKNPQTPQDYIYFDANCSQKGVLSDVCPGATVSTEEQAGEKRNDQVVEEDKEGEETTGTTMALRFPQLPASQRVVCVKCPDQSGSKTDCTPVITVAAAPPQGPQACAVGGTSITLEINKAGGSAQFKCGKERTLEPSERTKAYADDCSKVDTLKDMTRSDDSKSRYVTVTVGKLKKKKLCYLCQPSISGRQQREAQDGPCKVYVQVGGSTKASSSAPYGLALPCLAAMLRFT